MEINGFKIDKFNVHGFDVGTKTEGKVNCTCVFCSKDRKPVNQKTKCATVYFDTAFYECFHCGEKGQLHTYEKNETKKEYKKPKINLIEQQYSNDLINYIHNVRKIKESTLKHFKVVEKKLWFSFPYILNGEVINVKSRTIDKKFQMAKDAEKIFYNLESIRTQDTAIIVEGEFDVLAYYEAGIYNVVSVPNGFNKKGVINMSYLDDYYNFFENKEKIIIAVDNDEAGEHGKKELIRRFGAEKCYTVDFKDCKDANDYLIKYGAVSLSETIEEAEEIPLDHIESVKDYLEELEDFYLNGMPKGYTTGIENLDNCYSTELGQYTIVTGPPQSGKSEIVDAMCLGYALKYGFKTAFASPENKPNKLHSDKILRKIIGYRPHTEQNLQSKRYKDGIKFLDSHFDHVEFKGFDLLNTLKKFKELVKRKGTRVFVLDPFNKIKLKESANKNINDYTNDYLNEVDKFCRETQSICFVVCHPVKMDKIEGTKTFKMPTAYNIKGGGEMFDMAYHILGFVRDVEKRLVMGETLKVKFQHLGAPDQSFWLGWNVNNGRYLSIPFDPEVGMQEVTGWDNNSWLMTDEQIINESPKEQIQINNDTGEVNLTPMAEIEHNYRNGNVFKDNKSNFEKEAKTGYEIPLPGDGDFQAIETEPPF